VKLLSSITSLFCPRQRRYTRGDLAAGQTAVSVPKMGRGRGDPNQKKKSFQKLKRVAVRAKKAQQQAQKRNAAKEGGAVKPAWKGKKLKGVALKASSGGVTKKKGKARGSGKDVAMQGDN